MLAALDPQAVGGVPVFGAGAEGNGELQNRQRELQFLNDVTEFRGAKALHVAAAENVSYVTWQFDYTHREWGIRNYTQVSVQHWKNGKITGYRIYSAAPKRVSVRFDGIVRSIVSESRKEFR